MRTRFFEVVTVLAFTCHVALPQPPNDGAVADPSLYPEGRAIVNKTDNAAGCSDGLMVFGASGCICPVLGP